MRYLEIDKCDSANGPGVRTVLWCAGCLHHCKGCHNPQTWNPDQGTFVTEETIEEILDSISKPYIQGLTFSGGDPLHPNNRDDVYRIAKRCKETYPEKNIWCWTGYDWDDVKDLPALKFIDVLVDGKFIESQKNIRLKHRGSENQRVIDVKKSLDENTVILYEE